jgi:hypothetical protein
VSDDGAERRYWRVGYRHDPLGFVPHELCAWSHRFDDVQRRVRTLYVAELPETSLREVIADFRPKLSAIRRFMAEMGPEAAQDLAAHAVSAAWRRQHVVAPAGVVFDGAMCDLTDVSERQAIEARHLDVALGTGARDGRRRTDRELSGGGRQRD